MSSATLRNGEVLSPVVTPFDADLAPDADRLVAQCRWLIDNDVGLAVFGTNSEANSLSVGEKRRLLEALVGAGLPVQRMMPGTGCCAYVDSIELCRAALELGVTRVLMLPPFYYKGVSDDGLFDAYARIIDGVADERLRIHLYHIPPVSQVPISGALIERLLARFPGIIAGIKDSSGDWSNTAMMLERFQPQGFDVYAGSETFLMPTLRQGGAGCISATANVNPGAIAALARNAVALEAAQGRNGGTAADDAQAALDQVRSVFQRFPMIPAMKAAIARAANAPDWARVRPPLVPLDAAQAEALARELDAIGFSISGL
jgi:4-hydroxy-tetrahydrodipicolinate synthase